MGISGKTIWGALLGLVVLVGVGYGGYQYARHRWGQQQLQAAHDALERRDFRQAGAYLKEYLAVWPEDLAVRLQAARTFRRLGDLADAWTQLSHIEEKTILARELVLFHLQRGDMARTKELLATLRAQPRGADNALVLEAILVGCLGRLPSPTQRTAPPENPDQYEELSLARQALALWGQETSSPADRVQGLVWSGRIHWAANDYPRAIAELREAIRLDPEHTEARRILALAIVQEAPREAIEHLEILLRRDPENRELRFWLGSASRGIGQLDEARRLFDALLAEDPDNVPTLIERANLALDLHQVADAQKRLDRALTLAPGNPEVHLALSRCFQAVGQTAEARAHYDQFLRLQGKR